MNEDELRAYDDAEASLAKRDRLVWIKGKYKTVYLGTVLIFLKKFLVSLPSFETKICR